MQALFIIPMFMSIYYIWRGQIEKAFLNVYLPCTFLMPYYYAVRVPHLPLLSAGDAALLPIGMALLFRPKSRWRFTRMDLWVTIFVAGYAISEVTREYVPKDGMSLWLQDGFVEMFLAYIVGRQVIEPELRLETIKRILFLIMIQVPFAFYEFRFGQNPWLNIGRSVFGLYDVGWFVQLRGGTARIATSFSGAIVAGMMFMVVASLNFFLMQIYKENKTRLGPRMAILQKYRLPFFLLPILVFMTGSRMPLACTLLVFLIALIPRFKSIRTGVIVILLVAGTGAVAVYGYFERYTSVSEDAAMDEAQTSAIYRKQLIENYAPILETGGWLGYGQMSHPIVMGQGSIDNGYMLVQLSQGKLGKYVFEIIVFESIFSLALKARRFKSRENLFFTFFMMGALIGLFVSLISVAMGEQTPQVIFLLLGWSQSILDSRPVGAGASAESMLPEPKFRFRRVIA